jgi:di/tricarboxylate transporter
VPGKIGDRSGDTLLLEARPSFVEQQRHSRDCLLVSAIEGSTPPRHDRAWIAAAILTATVAGATFAGVPMLVAALVAGGLMIATRCTTGTSARHSVDWQVLVVIGAALGLGLALKQTGAADCLAHRGVKLVGQDPWAALLVIYLITSLFTAII